jgi:5-methylcytosine-specific restriction endonuclease McrA
MSESIPASLARQVVVRANETCEYCKLPQCSQEATFHIDHIQPRADGGETTEANLALACVSCSLKKATRILALDPKTKKMVRLFHPREDRWSGHFRWNEPARDRAYLGSAG